MVSPPPPSTRRFRPSACADKFLLVAAQTLVEQHRRRVSPSHLVDDVFVPRCNGKRNTKTVVLVRGSLVLFKTPVKVTQRGEAAAELPDHNRLRDDRRVVAVRRLRKRFDWRAAVCACRCPGSRELLGTAPCAAPDRQESAPSGQRKAKWTPVTRTQVKAKTATGTVRPTERC